MKNVEELNPDGLSGHTPPEESSIIDLTWIDVGKRKRTSLLEDIDPQPSKMIAADDPIEGTTREQTRRVVIGKRVVILIKSQDHKAIFSNPKRATDLLNASPFGKYIIEDSTRLLGRGVGYRFEITDLNKLDVDLSDITKLGPHSVKCWVPQSGGEGSLLSSCGKIGPIDVEMSEEEILNDIKILGFANSVLTDVSRMKTYNKQLDPPASTPSMYIKLKFQGPLPDRVAIGLMSYQVFPWIYPVLRCYNCWRFAHGILTCRATVRCARCSGFHKSNDCINAPKCYFCNGDHPINYANCPIYIKAKEIMKDSPTPTLVYDSPLSTALRDLNPKRAKVNNSSTSISPSFNHKRNTISDPLHLKGTYTMLPDELGLSEDESMMGEMESDTDTPFITTNINKDASKKSHNPWETKNFFFHSDLRSPTAEILHNKNEACQNVASRLDNKRHTHMKEADVDDTTFWANMMSQIISVIGKFFNSYISSHSFGKAINDILFDFVSIVQSIFRFTARV